MACPLDFAACRSQGRLAGLWDIGQRRVGSSPRNNICLRRTNLLLQNCRHWATEYGPVGCVANSRCDAIRPLAGGGVR
jgi:hypothetical protein